MPTNTTLREGTSLAEAVSQLQQAGLQYPLLAKPVWADGRDGSHALAVLGTEAGLQQLVEGQGAGGFGLPVLVQQYVDHGGCLFKVGGQAMAGQGCAKPAALSRYPCSNGYAWKGAGVRYHGCCAACCQLCEAACGLSGPYRGACSWHCCRLVPKPPCCK